MQRYGFTVAVALMMIGLAAGVAGPAAAEEARVNLAAEREPVQSVAAQISEQTGVQVAITANTDTDLTGQLENRTVEEAVAMLAEGAEASWLRLYLLETVPPQVPYSAEELLARLSDAREELLEGLTEERRRELLRPVARPARDDAEPARDAAQMLAGPGGGVAAVRAAREDAPEGRGGIAAMGQYDDQIRRLLLPGREDTISLDLTMIPFSEALAEFTVASGFFVLADEGIDGTVTLSSEDAPVEEVLDEIAEAGGAIWRPVYVVGQPRPLTQQERAERVEQMRERGEEAVNRMWSEFWQRPPEERAQWVDRGVNLIQRVSERMEDVPPERRRRMERLSGRIFDHMVGYSTRLTPEQRLEIRPLLQALARARAD